MFRDSRGVVHTVSSADPLEDLPPGAARALQDALLRPTDGDVANALERCDAVRELVERWQDAFFASLPDDFDVDEERRWAAEAGMSLDDIEAEYAEDEPVDDEPPLEGLEDLLPGEPLLDDEPDEDDPRSVLPEELVGLLERELLLLPVRVRLEALVAAADLVGEWAGLVADHEKLLGHLMLRHGGGALPHDHDELAVRHADLHSLTGPGHGT